MENSPKRNKGCFSFFLMIIRHFRFEQSFPQSSPSHTYSMCVFAGGYLTSKDRLTSNITRILLVEIRCTRAQTANLAFMGCCLFFLPRPAFLQYHATSQDEVVP